jgi:hypothetical protein
MRSIAGFNGSSINGSFAAGSPISASALNQLASGIDKALTMPSNDIQFMGNTGGTAYSLGQQVYYGNAVPPPLNPRLDNDKITVYPGTVNRIVPKIEDDYLDATTPPSITVTGEGYICIKLTYVASTFFPRTAEIIFFEGSVTPEDTETEGYYPLSKINSVTVDEVTTYSQIVLSYGNFVCNRLKSGANPAAWYWATITPQPGA